MFARTGRTRATATGISRVTQEMLGILCHHSRCHLPSTPPCAHTPDATALPEAAGVRMRREMKFLCLVMAVEALLEPPPRSADARGFIDQVLRDLSASDLADREKQSLAGSLRWLLKDSISSSGRLLARERLAGRLYDEMEPDKFFNLCYDLRSKLVHGHGVRGDDPIVGRTAATMELFVADLLAGYRIGFDL